MASVNRPRTYSQARQVYTSSRELAWWVFMRISGLFLIFLVGAHVFINNILVDAGTISNLDWDNPRRIPPSYREDFRIIAQSPSYPRALEMVRGDLDARIRARLREVLLEAGNDPDAREALLQFFGTTRFLPLDGQTMESLEALRHGVARVRAEVE